MYEFLVYKLVYNFKRPAEQVWKINQWAVAEVSFEKRLETWLVNQLNVFFCLHVVCSRRSEGTIRAKRGNYGKVKERVFNLSLALPLSIGTP